MGKQAKERRGNLISQIRHSFQTKVLLSILAPIVAFCIVTNIVISALLGHQLMEKQKDVEEGYLSVIYSYLEDAKDNIDTLALIAENSSIVRWAMSKSSLDSMETKKYALYAQESLAASLRGNPVNDYVDSMALVNREGMVISITASTGISQAGQIFENRLFQEDISNGKAVAQIGESVIDSKETKLIYIYPLDREKNSFIYMELNTRLFSDLLEPYRESLNIMIESEKKDHNVWYSSLDFQEIQRSGKLKGRTYTDSLAFQPFSLKITVVIESNFYSADNINIIYMLLITVIMVLCAGSAVSRLISKQVTQPLRGLSGHISRLAEEKVLTEDPSIEEGEDEISKIGKEFNHLVRHINSLIKSQKKMYEQRQRLEMNALQAQINPHFLYNTLDSVRWMAVIQKANNIADTVMSLENLLRNMAKGVGDKITLKEELSLVQDYVNLQKVRYMEIFDYICSVPEEYLDCLIVKMTMQPIIENAIFHGIEPTGTYGVIRVKAWEKENSLYISVEDNGVGMDQKELSQILKVKKNKNAMSGIGVVNVDERLKMTYGQNYGLIYEGKKGSFTRVTIHIPKEGYQDE